MTFIIILTNLLFLLWVNKQSNENLRTNQRRIIYLPAYWNDLCTVSNPVLQT